MSELQDGFVGLEGAGAFSASAEQEGVVLVHAGRMGSGFVWRAWFNSEVGQASHIITSAHLFWDITGGRRDERAREVKVTMGTQTAHGRWVCKHPSEDLALLAVNRALRVAGRRSFERPIYRGNLGRSSGLRGALFRIREKERRGRTATGREVQN